MLSAIMLSVIMLSVIMLNVMAPFSDKFLSKFPTDDARSSTRYILEKLFISQICFHVGLITNNISNLLGTTKTI